MAVHLHAPDYLPEIAGITVGTGAAGIRQGLRQDMGQGTGQGDRTDLAVLLCEPGTRAAGCFTRNRFQAAPVTVAREHLAACAAPRALVINSGNANAGTGEAGCEDARAVCRALAELGGVAQEEVLPFSTGVIGQRLPRQRIVDALPDVLETARADGWLDAARAIMTTDTVAKGAWRQFDAESRTVTLTGVVKGSGMIRPDMATMLAFIATDAALGPQVLQDSLARAMDRSFHRITVDGDTSTNDACMLLATGRRGELDGPDVERFQEALDDLCRELAQAVVRDAEGATKFVEVAVSGADNDTDARHVAMTVAHSPLVKTALFACDANWGRILAAVGRAPVERLDVERVSIAINGLAIVTRGGIDRAYREDQGAAAMAEQEIVIGVDLGVGEGVYSVWTSDLSHEYVTINAEYRT